MRKFLANCRKRRMRMLLVMPQASTAKENPNSGIGAPYYGQQKQGSTFPEQLPPSPEKGKKSGGFLGGISC